MAHSLNPSTQEAVAGGFLFVQSHLGLSVSSNELTFIYAIINDNE